MKKLICPPEIGTLTELKKWVDDNKPDTILIGQDSKILAIREFGDTLSPLRWKRYRGIPVEYDD